MWLTSSLRSRAMASKGDCDLTCALRFATGVVAKSLDTNGFGRGSPAGVGSLGAGAGPLRPPAPPARPHAGGRPMPGGTYAVALRVRRCHLWEVSTHISYVHHQQQRLTKRHSHLNWLMVLGWWIQSNKTSKEQINRTRKTTCSAKYLVK